MATKVLNGLDLQNQRIQSVSDPSAATDAATKQYVDARVAGLTWKEAVRAASTANVTLASVDAGSSLDGVTLALNDRVLIKNQTNAQDNGIYVVNADTVAPTRASDVPASSPASYHNATVFVREGTTQADTAWVQTATIVTVGTTPQTWAQFGAGGGATYTAGGGLTDTPANTFNVGEGDGINVAADAVSVDAGAGLTFSSGALVVGAGTGITVNADDVALAASVAGNGLTHTTGVLAVGAGTGISVAADTVSVTTPFTKFAATVGGSTSINVDHNLNTTDVLVEVFEVATGATVLCDVTRSTVNRVVLAFAAAPAASSLRVVVHA